MDSEVFVCQYVTNCTVLPPQSPIPLRESPAIKAGLIRVYGQWDNYRTNSDEFMSLKDFIAVHSYRPNCTAFRRIFSPEGESAHALLFRHH